MAGKSRSRLAICVCVALSGSVVLAGSADAAIRVKPKRAVPGQVVVVSGVKAGKVRVSIGAKRAKVVRRQKRRVHVLVPKLKPGKKRVVVRQGRKTSRTSLRVGRAFTGRVTPTLEPLLAASAEVGPAGGTVSARGSNGTAYELTVPAGALTAKTLVTMTPIARLSGLPSGKSTRNAVHFAPEGLQFAVPAELRVTPVLGNPVALTASGAGKDAVFHTGRKDGSSFVVEVAHFSLGATVNMSLQDFENLLASWAGQPMTLAIAAQFYDMLPNFNHAGFCSSSPTCQVVRQAADNFVGDFARHPDGGGCAEAAEAAFIHELEGTVNLIFEMEADRQLLGDRALSGLTACRANLVGRMYRLIHDTAPNDPLGVSGPCAHTQVDLDRDGRVQEIECAVRVAGTAGLQGFTLTRGLAVADIQAGLRKILTDGKRQCEEERKFEEGVRLLIRGAQYGQALNDSGALAGLDGEFDAAINECEPRITVAPASPSVEIGETEDFTATSEDPTDTSFTWSVDKGTIDSSGHFTAPTEPGPVVVKATSPKAAWFPTAADPNRVGKTTVDVTCPEGQVAVEDECREVTITISPTSATVSQGATRQFTATVTGTPDTRVSWSANGGSVTQAGLFTAPATAGQYTVTAASVAAPSKQATATVTVPAGVVVELTGRVSTVDQDSFVNSCGAGDANDPDTVTGPTGPDFSGQLSQAAQTAASNDCGSANGTTGQVSGLAAAAANADTFDLTSDFSASASATANDEHPTVIASVSSSSGMTVYFRAVGGDATITCDGTSTGPGSQAMSVVMDHSTPKIVVLHSQDGPHSFTASRTVQAGESHKIDLGFGFFEAESDDPDNPPFHEGGAGSGEIACRFDAPTRVVLG